MPGYYIRNMKMTEIKDFYKHIEQDFSHGEYDPFDVLQKQLENGIQEGLVFCKDGQDLAYSVCAAGDASGCVLISLLAVFPEYRGQGIGSEFIGTLCKIYEQKKAVIVEVERPETSETPEEHDSRIRRIKFYEKAGFSIIPGIDYTIWDVPMHLMSIPIKASVEIINENIGQIMYQIYLKLMGKRFIHKMELKIISSEPDKPYIKPNSDNIVD